MLELIPTTKSNILNPNKFYNLIVGLKISGVGIRTHSCNLLITKIPNKHFWTKAKFNDYKLLARINGFVSNVNYVT